MCGDNRYVDDLGILTAIELYLNYEFYSKHPSFISLISKHSKVFSSIDTILAISVSLNALVSNKTKGELVQKSTDTVQNFSSDLSNVSDVPLSALEKTVTTKVSCFNSNPEFPSLCSDKSVIATSVSSLNSGKSINDSNLDTADDSLGGVGAVSTCNRCGVATDRSKAPFISDIEKKDLIKNVLFLMITSLFQKPTEVLNLNGSSGSLGYVILPVKMQFVVWLVFYLIISFLKRYQESKNVIPSLLDIGQQQSEPVKYMSKGRKKRKKVLMSHANHCIVKHGLFLVISWLI